jgi:Uma2 family endonuclease
MSAELKPPPMTVDEFLVWGEGREGRFELENGTVVAMAPERVEHAEAKAAIHAALAAACRAVGLGCRALPDGMTVRVDAGRAYEPDALVYCGPRLPREAVTVEAPVVVVEVLSPSTAQRDMADKLAGYFRVASIQHYLIVDPDGRRVIHHQRGEGDLVLTRIAAGGALVLEPPGLAVRVADLMPETDDPPS